MPNKIISTVFNATVVLVAVSTAVWLTITGHTLQIGGLLMTMGALLGAVIFGLRLAEGFEPYRLSIWAGPLDAIWRRSPAFGKAGDGLREAA